MAGEVPALGKADGLTAGDRRLPTNACHVVCHVEYRERHEAEDGRVMVFLVASMICRQACHV
jgi:hypothetical protein